VVICADEGEYALRALVKSVWRALGKKNERIALAFSENDNPNFLDCPLEGVGDRLMLVHQKATCGIKDYSGFYTAAALAGALLSKDALPGTKRPICLKGLSSVEEDHRVGSLFKRRNKVFAPRFTSFCESPKAGRDIRAILSFDRVSEEVRRRLNLLPNAGKLESDDIIKNEIRKTLYLSCRAGLKYKKTRVEIAYLGNCRVAEAGFYIHICKEPVYFCAHFIV
jgi:hypothetical protein